MTPESKARQQIDQKLEQAGWVVQDMKQLNLGAARGVAVREFPTDSGPADYMLFVDRAPVGVIEAKKDSAGVSLNVTESQTERYANATFKWQKNSAPLRFLFEATGQIIRFTDNADPAPRSREIFHFFKPETLAAWLAQPETLRRRLAEQMPALPDRNLRDCQISAVTGLEKSLALNKPRALVHMATGAGKTFTAITSVYRLLKFGGAKRILFLVDTRNLGKQAHQEFMAYMPPDDGRKFTELYNVQRLASPNIDPHSQVCISTIQRMYSILSGEPIDESAEDVSLNEVQQTTKQEKLVRYNPAVPVETFDFIIIDECHRSIYNLWKQVLDYFDASLIGLTATPDKRTFGFFNENIVAEYTYEQSVADGVNVGYDVYEIETEITKKGAELKAKEWVDHRDRATRKKRWGETEEDTAYTGKELDKSVVNVSQIRQVIQAMKSAVETQIFPARKETPKTLIFAKTDSHADDIINIVREVYGQGNAFCKKVTYRVEEDADSILSSFRNDYNPRIAVTVDMIATGTDVKPLEVLLFMRDVRSKGYYEQMKGRGVRSLDGESLMRLTGTRFERRDVVDEGALKQVLEDAVELLEGKGTADGEDDLREQLLRGYRYILVDEYQDIDALQYRLVSALAGRQSSEEGRLCILAVGDDDQNIYAWRDTNNRYIERFREDYSAATSYLVENYRSTQRIIAAANQLVGNNPGRLKASYPIRINRERQSDPLGGQWQALDSGRSGRVTRLVVESSDRAVGNLQAQAAIGELKRLLALEEGSWSGCAILARTHQYLWPVQALCELAGVPYFLASDKDSALPITRQRDFVAVVDRLREVNEALSAAMAWQQVSAGVSESWRSFFQEAFTQLQIELGECQLNSAAIVDWLYDYAREMRQQAKNGLYLGTVHSAKGLEFRHVVLLDGGWNVQAEGLNDERRLYYVGMTRAEQTLTLCEFSAANPFSGSMSADIAQQTLTGDYSAALERRYLQLSLKDIDIGFAGRSPLTDPIHEALRCLELGTELKLEKQGERYLIWDAQGRVVGRTSQSFKLDLEVERCEVAGVLVRFLEDSEEQYRSLQKCDSWEIVVPRICGVPI